MRTLKYSRMTQIVAGILSILLVCPYSYAAQVGTVTYVEGRVDILKAGEETPRPLRGDEKVDVGDIFRTKSNSKAEITFIDESILYIAENSRIEVKDYQLHEDLKRKDATISIHRGKVRAIIAKMKDKAPFNVDTPNAHGTIKGSEIFAFFQAGSTGMLVSSGKLTVVNPTLPQMVPVVVTPGNSILLPQEGSPQGPRPFLDLEKKFHENDTTPPLIVARRNNINIIEGVVTKLSGDVMITPKDEKEAVELVVNAFVKTGDTIVTGEDGLVEMKFDNGNSVNMKPNSHLVILKLIIDPKTKEFDNEFEVSKGQIKAVVEKIEVGSTFKVRTPHAISGVRGTVMFLNVTDELTNSFFEGGPGYITSLISGTTLEVPMGESSTADAKGNVTDPVPVTGSNRSNYAQGWVPGSGIEGYSVPEGVTNKYLFEDETNIQEIQASGEDDGALTDSGNEQAAGSKFIDVPLTEAIGSPASGGSGGGTGNEEPSGSIQAIVQGLFNANNPGGIDGKINISSFPWDGSQPMSLSGDFSNPDSGKTFSASVGGNGKDGSALVGSLNGINNSLEAVFYGLYIRPVNDTFLAGFLESTNLSGDFNFTNNTFSAIGNVNAHLDLPTNINPSTFNGDSLDLVKEESILSVGGGNFEGNINQETKRISDQNWNIFSLDGVGPFVGRPQDNDDTYINAFPGIDSSVASGFYQLSTDFKANNEFSAEFFGNTLSATQLGTVQGKLNGVYEQNPLVSAWQAIGGGTTIYQPLNFSGVVNGFSGNYDPQSGDFFPNGSVTGRIGGLDPLLGGSSFAQIFGSYGTQGSEVGLWVLDLSGQDIVQGGKFLGTVGIQAHNPPLSLNSNSLDGMLSALYIRPDGADSHRAGVIESTLFAGNTVHSFNAFGIGTNLFSTFDNATIYTPEDLFPGSSALDLYGFKGALNSKDNNLTGNADLTAVLIGDQNWGIWSGFIGGDFESPFTSGWESIMGGEFAPSGQEPDGYFLGDLSGGAWQNNNFSATATGFILTNETLGTFDGNFLGEYGQAWQGIGQGTVEFEPLAFGEHINGGIGPFNLDAQLNEVGTFSTIFGGTEAPFTGPAGFVALGQIDRTGAQDVELGPLWLGSFQQINNADDATFRGTAGGFILEDGTTGGLLTALYVRPDGQGGLLGGALRSTDITGVIYPQIDMLQYQGLLTSLKESPVNMTVEDFISGNGVSTRNFGVQTFTGDITGSTLGHVLLAQAIAGNNWEVFWVTAGGEFEVVPSNDWSAEFGSSTEDFTVTGQITGQKWEDNEFRATVSGQVLTHDKLGIIEGNFIGRYADDGTTLIDGSEWAGFLAGITTYQPLAFGGDFVGQFGVVTSGDFVPTNNSQFNGNLGGTQSFFGQNPNLTIQGAFQNPNDDFIWESTGFNVSGQESGAAFLGTLLGTKTDVTLNGLFNSFYIRPDGQGGNRAGVLQSFSLNGNFFPATDLFEANGSVQVLFDLPTNFTPDELLDGSASFEFEPAVGNIDGEMFASGNFTKRGIKIIDQEWDIWKINGGGLYNTIPASDWDAVSGNIENVEFFKAYSIFGFHGNAWQDGKFQGTINGRHMQINTDTGVGTIAQDQGSFIGNYNQTNSTYQIVGAGIGNEEQPLAFASLVNGVFFNLDPNNPDEDASGLFTAILGGVDFPWVETTAITMLGEFDNPDDHPLWSTGATTIEGHTADGGKYLAFVGGGIFNNHLTGLLNSIYIRPDGNGFRAGRMYSNDLTGNAYPRIGMFELDGSVKTNFDQVTNITPDDFFIGSTSLFDSLTTVGQIVSSDFTGFLVTNEINIIDQNWGIFTGSAYGTYTQLPGDNWKAGIYGSGFLADGQQVIFDKESWMAAAKGSTWSNNLIQGTTAGIWVELNLNGSLSGGRSTGNITGTYVDVNEGAVWQAATTGEWVEVDEILNLTGVNDDITALGTVDIPVTEVYSSLLSGAGTFQAGGAINANNVQLNLYSTDLLVDSGIWAAQLSGTYTNPSGGPFGFDVSGNFIDNSTNNVVGTVDVTFAGTDWANGQWLANVAGITDTGLILNGSAAGTYNENGGFTGAGTGTWQPE